MSAGWFIVGAALGWLVFSLLLAPVLGRWLDGRHAGRPTGRWS